MVDLVTSLSHEVLVVDGLTTTPTLWTKTPVEAIFAVHLALLVEALFV